MNKYLFRMLLGGRTAGRNREVRLTCRDTIYEWRSEALISCD